MVSSNGMKIKSCQIVCYVIFLTVVVERKKKTTIHFNGIFLLHFLNGTLAGIAYPFLFYSVFSYLRISDSALISMIGILYGIVLWLLTLIPIHKPITGFSPWNHPLGRLPALASLGGHVVYGIVLGLFVETLSPDRVLYKL